MVDQVYKENPEPVPSASQLAVLPFLAAIEGFLAEGGKVAGLRITIHRAMSRENQSYLQQLCAYVTSDGLDGGAKVGRTFPVNEGIMGAAYEKERIWRTKSFPSREDLISVMHKDMLESGDKRDPGKVAIAYLAVPFLGPDKKPVLILYADCNELNFFANDERVRRVTAMCNGFCRMFDVLQQEPFSNVRNFPLPKGDPVIGPPTLYVSIQEAVPTIDPPLFSVVSSFNFEAAVA